MAIPATQRPVSPAEINRELTTLKRMLNLAIDNNTLAAHPKIKLLTENNVRTGFFEPDQFAAMPAHLPPALQPPIRFACLTGWRISSEVLPLQWRHVDFAGGEIRLDPGTTKNREGRVFPMTAELRTLLQDQWTEHEWRKQAGQIAPWVFFRMFANGRGGAQYPKPITAFAVAWSQTCVAAGCPGRIPHDLRRTAVRNFVRTGIPERVTMTLSGHKTRSVFERYNIVSSGDLKDAARRLDEAMGTRKGQSADQPTFSGTQPNSLTASESVA